MVGVEAISVFHYVNSMMSIILEYTFCTLDQFLSLGISPKREIITKRHMHIKILTPVAKLSFQKVEPVRPSPPALIRTVSLRSAVLADSASFHH